MKFVSLLSSGIDSPVATYLMASKTEEMIFVHADNRPFTDDKEIQNFITLAKYLKKIMSCKTTAFTVPHGKTLASYQQSTSEKKYTCLICKRMLLRYAEKIATLQDAKAIIMGDSLGQVASQTLQNLRVVDQAVILPVLRPLIGYDKQESIRIAQTIGTYDLSIQKSTGCQAVPNKPSTRAQISKIISEENKIDVMALVEEVVSEREKIQL